MINEISLRLKCKLEERFVGAFAGRENNLWLINALIFHFPLQMLQMELIFEHAALWYRIGILDGEMYICRADV